MFTAATVSAVDVGETAYGNIAGEQKVAVLEATPLPEATEAAVRSYFADVPIMIEVARCESTFRHQLADGSILQGRVDPADTGVMQINKRYHESTATAMELDLDNLYDNMAYARYLYEKQGTQPWSASMPCWGGSLAANF
ncbi:hypothetical protein KC902_02550 [Candidatus Kaiserbacteria bacterium]|nr:hypothetical protein [Candidatus Kaiserbacteria bacterium]